MNSKTIGLKIFDSAPRDDPLSYPGKRPNHSFLFDGNYIRNLSLCSGANIISALEKIGVDPDNAYVMMGYGSNACPAQLASKFGQDMRNMPVIRGFLEGFDVVYAAGFAAYGAIPATLSESAGTTVEVWVNILDRKQVRAMDSTEGLGTQYYLAEMPIQFKAENGVKISPVHAYIHSAGALAPEKQLVALAGIPASRRRFEAQTQKEILNWARKTIMPECADVDELVNTVRLNRESATHKLKAFRTVTQTLNVIKSVNQITENITIERNKLRFAALLYEN